MQWKRVFMFLYYLFYISLDCYCLHDHRFESEKKEETEKTEIYNIKHCWVLFSFVALCSINAIRSYRTNVITWSFFFLFFCLFFSCACVVRFPRLKYELHRMQEKYRDSLKLRDRFFFVDFVKCVYLEILLVSGVPNINTV